MQQCSGDVLVTAPRLFAHGKHQLECVKGAEELELGGGVGVHVLGGGERRAVGGQD